MLINILVFFACVAAMEWVAWFTHKYFMHGPLWVLHRSHHVPNRGGLERNDWFAVFFSMPSIVLIWFGTNGHPRLLWAGLGVAMYGLLYFVFHDIVVHRRLGVRLRPGGAYMRRIIQAHMIHHSTHTREGAVSFGFLYSPPVGRLRR